MAISDTLTAFVAGLAVFACLGHLSLPSGPDGTVATDPVVIEAVARASEAGQLQDGRAMIDGTAWRPGTPVRSWMGSSLGIAFVAYPTLISKIAFGRVLGPIFFIMLLLLAIDSAFSLVEAGVKPLEDKFGWSHHKALFTIGSLGFLLGIPFMFQSGLYWFDTIDYFMNQFGLALACLAECVVFGWIYGARRIRAELREHRENHLGAWWDIMIRYVSPAVLVALVAWEIKARLAGSYEGYGRTVEFFGGWMALILIAAGATILTFMKGRDDRRD